MFQLSSVYCIIIIQTLIPFRLTCDELILVKSKFLDSMGLHGSCPLPTNLEFIHKDRHSNVKFTG